MCLVGSHNRENLECLAGLPVQVLRDPSCQWGRNSSGEAILWEVLKGACSVYVYSRARDRIENAAHIFSPIQIVLG